MKPTLHLKAARPSISGAPALKLSQEKKPHPLAAFVGHKVVIQILRSPGRIEGHLEAFETGWLRLTSAKIIGTQHLAKPKDGVILVAREEVGHIHLEAVVEPINAQGGAV